MKVDPTSRPDSKQTDSSGAGKMSHDRPYCRRLSRALVVAVAGIGLAGVATLARPAKAVATPDF